MGKNLPDEFIINADYNGIVMAIRHKTCQFVLSNSIQKVFSLYKVRNYYNNLWNGY